MGMAVSTRLTGTDVLRTNSDFFYNGDYGGLVVDGVRSFDNQRFGVRSCLDLTLRFYK